MAEKVELELTANVDKALEEIDKLKNQVGDLTDKLDGVKEGVDNTNKSIKGMKAGFNAAGLALKAIGIGVLIKGFQLFTQILGQNQKVLDFFETAMTAAGIAVNDFFEFVQNNVGTVTGYFKELFENPELKLRQLAKTIQEYVVQRIQLLIDGFGKLGEAIGAVFAGDFERAKDAAIEGSKAIGQAILELNPASAVLIKLGKTVYENRDAIEAYTKSLLDNAEAIVNNRTELELLRVQQETLRQQYDVLAERQRQIRDDERLTFDERIAANDKLLQLLKDQARLEAATVTARIAALEKEQRLQGATNERLIKILELKKELLDVEATVAGFVAEQRTNEVTLLNEKAGYEKQFTKTKADEINQQAKDRQAAYDAEEKANKKKNDQIEADDKKLYENKIAIAQATVSITQSLASIVGDQTEKGAKLNKIAALAQVAIDTAVAISGLTANSSGNPLNAVTFGAAGIAQFASGLAIILSNVAKAKSIIQNAPRVSKSGGGGGSLSTPSISRPSSPPRPSEPSQGNVFTIGGDVAERNETITKTYVLASDVSSKQAAQKQIEREARL